MKLKYVCLDLETTPILGFAWSRWNTNLLSVEKESQIICGAYKWVGDKGSPKFVRGAMDDPWDDSEMLKELWEVLNTADVVIGHNAAKFDVKRLNVMFLRRGMKPPSPFKVIDTLKVARKNFAPSSNKLDTLTQLIGVGSKTSHEGFLRLFRGTMIDNDEKSWRTMKRYNLQDVNLTLELYETLKPWIKNHPRNPEDVHKDHICPSCGSTHVQRRGIQMAIKYSYQRYHCQGCGSWYKGSKNLKNLSEAVDELADAEWADNG